MKGIMFKPEMIQAIREGKKTVTRRLSGLKEINKKPEEWRLGGVFSGCVFFQSGDEEIMVRPRYRLGEIVYLKEALHRDGELGDTCYDDEEMTPVFENGVFGKLVLWRWKERKLSKMFMPDWAARYFLRIRGFSFERLQEITNDDVYAEGVSYRGDSTIKPRDAYAQLWDSINKKYPWASNPWLTRYEFERVKRPEIVHYAKMVSAEGFVSPVCAAKPRQLNLAKESWSNRLNAVTCERCQVIALMAMGKRCQHEFPPGPIPRRQIPRGGG